MYKKPFVVYDYCGQHKLKRREELYIPIKDFITKLLNINDNDIEDFAIRQNDNKVIYDLTLKRKETICPYCGEIMIGHGFSRPKPIKVSSLREYDGIISYKANRYICKKCNHTVTEENPFAFKRFNASFQLLRTIFKYLGNLNYTLEMISNELNVSTTQINKYIDSYIVIPPRDLPEWLGIDEIHNPELSYKHSSYLCVLVDGEERCIYDVLGSRSKYYLNNYFMEFPLAQRQKVKYVTIDIWRPYSDIAKKCFPNCIVAIDPLCKALHKLSYGKLIVM